MTAQFFARILVPIDFQPATDEHIAAGEVLRVGERSVDLSPGSLRSIATATGLSTLSGGSVIFLHVTPSLAYSAMYTDSMTVGLSPQVVEELHKVAHDAAIATLQRIADLHCPGVAVELSARSGTPMDVILEEAAQRAVDLIVIPTSGRSRVARFFLGSTADRVIREAGCPVLVIPAHKRE
jgi:nucleotide-binding universal stress UspA family protein